MCFVIENLDLFGSHVPPLTSLLARHRMRTSSVCWHKLNIELFSLLLRCTIWCASESAASWRGNLWPRSESTPLVIAFSVRLETSLILAVITVHLRYLADTFIQSDLQQVDLSEERETTIYRCPYSKDVHGTAQSLTIIRLNHCPYTTKIARIRCYKIHSTLFKCQDVQHTISAYEGCAMS